MDATNLTLHEALARLGWRSEPNTARGRRVWDEAGALVDDTLSAHEAWTELRRRGLIL